MTVFLSSLRPRCVARAQPFGTLGWSWNVRTCYTMGDFSHTRPRTPETRPVSVPPSLLWVITNIVGTARDQSL